MPDSTCNTCRKWLQYPQKKDCGCGICIEPMNGHRGKYKGGLSETIGECSNYAPLTFHYLGCEYFEPKENK